MQIQCLVPAGPGGVSYIYANVSEQQSTPLWPFQYDAPVIAALSPYTVATIGGSVLVTGVNFGTLAVNAVLTLDGVLLSSSLITQINHTTVVFNLPSGTGVNKVLAINVLGQPSTYTAPRFLSYAPPVLTAISGCGPYDLFPQAIGCQVEGGTVSHTGRQASKGEDTQRSGRCGCSLSLSPASVCVSAHHSVR
jgi:hypothetical protein